MYLNDMRYFILIFIFFSSISCEKSTQQNLIISFEFTAHPGDSLKLHYQNELDFTLNPIETIVLDSLGHGQIELSIDEHKFAVVELGGKRFNSLLIPYGKQQISGSTDNLPFSLNYSGDGAEANKYRNDVSNIHMSYSSWKGKPFFLLDSLSFIARKKQIEYEATKLQSNLSSKLLSSTDLLKVLQLDTEMILMYESLNFELATQRELRINVEPILNNFAYLSTHSPNYLTAIALYLDSRVYKSIFDNYSTDKFDSLNKIFPELAFREIQVLQTSDSLKELLLARIIYSYVSSGSLTPSLVKTYNDWKDIYPNSNYLSIIEKEQSTLIKLYAGTTAPEIVGVTPTGDIVKLSDLIGNVVYIDIWATWCSPCIKSLPTLSNLAKKYFNENFQILCVSVDRNEGKWKSFLNDRAIAGTHVNVSFNEIGNNYFVSAIPRYILVGRDGKVIDVRAPAPDNKELFDTIDELIKHGR